MGKPPSAQDHQSGSLRLFLTQCLSYVLIAATASTILNFLHTAKVSKARKTIKLPYPHMLATTSNRSPDIKDSAQKSTAPSPLNTNTNDFGGLTRDEYIFNCAQRAHLNYGENLPTLLVSLLISGVAYPKAAAAMAGIWCVARFVYMVGYTKPEWGRNGNGRLRGGAMLWWPMQYGLVLMGGWVGVKMVLKM